MANETFDRYIRHGRAAVDTHPDYRPGGSGGIDFETAAIDTIASILHALDDEHGHPHEERAETSLTLDRSYGSYVGDFEDLDEGD